MDRIPTRRQRIATEIAEELRGLLQLDSIKIGYPKKSHVIKFHLLNDEIQLTVPIAKKVIFNLDHDFSVLVKQTIIEMWMVELKRLMAIELERVAHGHSN